AVVFFLFEDLVLITDDEKDGRRGSLGVVGADEDGSGRGVGGDSELADTDLFRIGIGGESETLAGKPEGAGPGIKFPVEGQGDLGSLFAAWWINRVEGWDSRSGRQSGAEPDGRKHRSDGEPGLHGAGQAKSSLMSRPLLTNWMGRLLVS